MMMWKTVKTGGGILLLTLLSLSTPAETGMTVGPAAEVEVTDQNGNHVSAEAANVVVVTPEGESGSVTVTSTGQSHVSASVTVNGTAITSNAEDVQVKVEVTGADEVNMSEHDDTEPTDNPPVDVDSLLEQNPFFR